MQGNIVHKHSREQSRATGTGGKQHTPSNNWSSSEVPNTLDLGVTKDLSLVTGDFGPIVGNHPTLEGFSILSREQEEETTQSKCGLQTNVNPSAATNLDDQHSLNAGQNLCIDCNTSSTPVVITQRNVDGVLKVKSDWQTFPIKICKCGKLYQKECICRMVLCLCGNYSNRLVCRLCLHSMGGSSRLERMDQEKRMKIELELANYYRFRKENFDSNKNLNYQKIDKSVKKQTKKHKQQPSQFYPLGNEFVNFRVRLRAEAKYGVGNYYIMLGTKVIDLNSEELTPTQEHLVRIIPRIRGGMKEDNEWEIIDFDSNGNVIDKPVIKTNIVNTNNNNNKIDPEKIDIKEKDENVENEELTEEDIKLIKNYVENLEHQEMTPLEKLTEYKKKITEVKAKKLKKKKKGQFNDRLGPKSEKKMNLIKNSEKTYQPTPNMDVLSNVSIKPATKVSIIFYGPKAYCPEGAILQESSGEPDYYYDAQLLNYTYLSQHRKVNFDNYLESPMLEYTAIVDGHNILIPPRNSTAIMHCWYPDHEQHSKDHLWVTRLGNTCLTVRRGSANRTYDFTGLHINPTNCVFRTLRLYQINDKTPNSPDMDFDQTMTVEHLEEEYVIPKYLYAFLMTLNPHLDVHLIRSNMDKIKKHFKESIIDVMSPTFAKWVFALLAHWSKEMKDMQHQQVVNMVPSLQNEKLTHNILNDPGVNTMWSLLDSLAKFVLPSFAYQYVHGALTSLASKPMMEHIKDFIDMVKSFFGFGPKMYAFRYINETTSIFLEEIIKTFPGGSLPIIILDIINLKKDGQFTWYNVLKTVLFHGWSDLIPFSWLRVLMLPFRVMAHVWWNYRTNSKEWSSYQMDQMQNENRKSILKVGSRQILKIQAKIEYYVTVEKMIKQKAIDTARPETATFMEAPGWLELRSRANAQHDMPIREIKRCVSYQYFSEEGTYYFADNDLNLYTGLGKRCYQPQEPLKETEYQIFKLVMQKIDAQFQDNRLPIDVNGYISGHVNEKLYRTHYDKTKRYTPEELRYRNTARVKSNEKTGKDIPRVYFAAEVSVTCRVGAVLAPFQWFLKEILFNGTTDLNDFLELGLNHEVYILYAARNSDEVGDFLFRAHNDTDNFYAAVLGDDSLASHLEIKIGSDMSRFDSTINKRLLALFKDMIAKDTTDPNIQVFLKQWDAPFGFDTKEDGWVQLPPPNGLPTGCCWTGVSNTLNMGVSFLVNLLLSRDLKDSVRTHTNLGWIAKPNYYTKDQFPEFLKRIWVPYGKTCYPVPIPSMLVKALGSTEERVELLVPLGRLRNDYGNIQAYNYGVMNSMLNVDDIPFFKPLKEYYFKETWLLKENYVNADPDAEYKLWKGSGKKEPLPNSLVHEAYTQRYNSDSFAHNMLLQTLMFKEENLYKRYSSPFIRTIMESDYGYDYNVE